LGSWDEVEGKKKSCSGTEFEGQRCDARDSNRTETKGQTYQRILYQGGVDLEWWQLERKDVGGSARFGNGMVLQMRIVVELCCTVLCSALATVGDLRRMPCWHRIGWRWARHRPPTLSSLALLSLSQTPSLALTGKRAIPLLAPHSPNQTGVDPQASSQHPAAASQTRCLSVVRTCCTRHPWVQQRNESIELTELA
jgi:hypothetical protein